MKRATIVVAWLSRKENFFYSTRNAIFHFEGVPEMGFYGNRILSNAREIVTFSHVKKVVSRMAIFRYKGTFVEPNPLVWIAIVIFLGKNR